MNSPTVSASPRQYAACEALVYNLLQRCESRQDVKGSALAFVSAHPGAGVSHIVRLSEQLLNENAAESAFALDCVSLGVGYRSGPPLENSVRDTAAIAPRSSLGRYRDRAEHLNSLRGFYQYVLLDCHSLKEKTDVLGLAPLVDGVIIVVEGNRTTKSQLDYLERSIEGYGGSILGCVLNKRTYPIPAWVNTWMERVGI